MPVIDAHVHVLPNFALMAPWEDLGRVDRLLHHMDECDVDKAVVLPVVAEYSPGNNQECAQWGREHPDRLAVLTDVPLRQQGAAERVLRAGEEFGAVGTSYYPPKLDESMQWMLEEACDALWQAYKDTGLVCNLQIGPANYGVLLELAQRHPEIRFVANHLALPGLAGGPDAQDETYGGLLQAAACPNLSIKASGFYAAAATSWDFRCPQALGFFSRLLKGLGADRLLWGSDWPPVGRHVTYRQSLEIVRTFATELDEGDRAKVLGSNAARVYGI